ncbi:MAG: hypothetical protein D3922_01260, partial [Candidatus Electrothrix sp. AR1]|nr:hypothetical protein [Candidatus Electrothrix sp. AR1]
ASENTFKHIKERHPYHYHPGFTLVESENQDIANPILKELKVFSDAPQRFKNTPNNEAEHLESCG